MLEKLLIQDFQPHGYLELDLSSPITCLTGSSDQGKSSILRALEWLCTNQPRGDYFIKHGCPQALATLWVDGHTITREKGRGKNTYWLDGGRPYEAFGAGVPDEVAQVLNLCPLNFQGQLDAPFLLSLSPGEASRELNQIVSLDLIDAALAYLASAQRQAKAATQVGLDRLQQAKERRDELKWVVEAEKQLKQVEELGAKVEQVMDDIADLDSMLADLRAIAQQLDGIEEEIEILDGLAVLGGQVEKAQEEITGLEGLLELLAENSKQVSQAQQVLLVGEQELQEKTQGLCPVCGGELKCAHQNR